MSAPFKMKGHSLPGPNQASKANNKEEKKDKLKVEISEDGSTMTRTKGNKSVSFKKNPAWDSKKGDTATEEWLEN